MKDAVIAKLANQAADFYGDAFKQCQYKDTLPKVGEGRAWGKVLLRFQTTHRQPCPPCWEHSVQSSGCMDGVCFLCLVACFFFFYTSPLCVFLENMTKSGSGGAGLLRFPPAPPFIGSLHPGFSWVFLVTTKRNRFPSGLLSYLTEDVKHLQAVSDENTHKYTPFLNAEGQSKWIKAACRSSFNFPAQKECLCLSKQ